MEKEQNRENYSQKVFYLWFSIKTIALDDTKI